MTICDHIYIVINKFSCYITIMCEVCTHKDQEIAFLRDTIRQLLAKKEQETSVFTPIYTNDLGQSVESTNAVVKDDNIKEESEILEGLT